MKPVEEKNDNLAVEPRRGRDVRLWLIGFVAYGLIVVLLYGRLWRQAPLVFPDTSSYQAVAVDLQHGSLSKLHDRTIGYPLLLLATGSTTHPTRTLLYIQLLMHMAVLAMLASLLVNLNVPRWLVVIFVLLGSLPPAVEPAANALTETPTAFLLTLGLFGLMRWLTRGSFGWLFGAALAWGFCGLVRPTFQLIAVLLTGVLLLAARWRVVNISRRRFWIGAVSLLAGELLIIGGMMAYNQARFGFAGLSPLLGRNLSTKTVYLLERLPDSYAPVRELLIRHRNAQLVSPESDHSARMYIWSATRDLEQTTGLSGGALSSYMLRLNLDLIGRAPLEYLNEVGRTIVPFWFPANGWLSCFGSRSLQFVWGLLHFAIVGAWLGYGVFLAGPSFLLFFSAAHSRDASSITVKLTLRMLVILLILGIVLYNMAISTFLEVGAHRYRVPTDLLLLFATVLAGHTWHCWRRQLEIRPRVNNPPPSSAFRSAQYVRVH